MNRDASATLAARLVTAPLVTDEAAAATRLDDFLASLDDVARQRLSHSPVRALLAGIADHSPFLWQLASIDPPRLVRLFGASPEDAFAECLALMTMSVFEADGEAAVMRILRTARQEVALLVALADLGGAWDIVEVTRALSAAGDAFVATATAFALTDAHRAGLLRLPDPAEPAAGCGLAILALGKHGGRELNYSSDTDLVVVFDPESSSIPPAGPAAPLFVNLTKKIARLLQQRTADGYVLRVDLRLRPDPGATAVAISVPAAFSYYELVGQNWERAAMIKARPIAGDIAVGQRFLDGLVPFIWRKYFDYAAIADIHAMKRQIHAVRGHADIAVAGHDVKLGRGGIREIEFFVQTQQLIFGGRRKALRGAQTLLMLDALRDDGWITAQAVADLTAAYRFLRDVEHRLQMVADEQTQRLPSDADALERFSRFCGFSDAAAFAKTFTHYLSRVAHHYALLFENEPHLDVSVGSLVFTGVDDDPETLETLTRLGFKDAARAVDIVRGWHHGRRSAIRTPRAREILTDLVPGLMEAFGNSGDPDAALATFDTALGHMPAVAELLSLLNSNRKLRELFADILGSAPRLARMVAQRPHLLDLAVTPDAFAAVDLAVLQKRGEAIVATHEATEEFLDAIRDFASEELFAIGVRLLSGVVTPAQAAAAYSTLAATVVRIALSQVEADFASLHGRVQGGRCVVVAMGKLGSVEMTAVSDLDLVLIYDFDREHPDSFGSKPLHAVQYYTRLAQRLVTALTVATRRGRLYDVDMRLRPSGRQGPIATQLESFRAYQRDEAETWEHMALTRARVIAGDAGLAADFETALADVLCMPRDKVALRRDVLAMRALIAKVKGDAAVWDLKLAAGGLVDIEFVAQYLVLSGIAPHGSIPSTRSALRRAATAGALRCEDAEILLSAHRLFSDVAQVQHLALDEHLEPSQASVAAQRRLAAAGDVPDLPRLKAELTARRLAVRTVFLKLLSGEDRARD